MSKIPTSDSFCVVSFEFVHEDYKNVDAAMAYATGMAPKPFEDQGYHEEIDQFYKDHPILRSDEKYYDTFFKRFGTPGNSPDYYDVKYFSPSGEKLNLVRLEIYLEDYQGDMNYPDSKNYEDEPWNDMKELKHVLERLQIRLGTLFNIEIRKILVKVTEVKKQISIDLE